MATFNWVISTLEQDLQPADMDGAIIVSHWRCTAEQTEGTGDDAVTEAEAQSWVWANGVDQSETETALQANITAQMNPTEASGVPW